MAGQSIRIKIADKEYQLVAGTPEMESAMRSAAAEINSMLSAYDARFPDRTLADKLSFVALNQTVGKAAFERKLKNAEAEASGLEAEVESYLKEIEIR